MFDKEAVSATLGTAVEEILKDQPYDHSKVGLLAPARAASSITEHVVSRWCSPHAPTHPQHERARWLQPGGSGARKSGC